ncbi:MAG: MFS transporter [Caldilineaceae bacterium]
MAEQENVLAAGRPASRPRWLLPALQTRNFRLFWGGQIVSLIGTSLQVIAEGWLIYDLTGSTFWLGMVGLLALIPVLPISLLGGLLIDRVPRRRLIMVTQAGLLVQAALFGLLALSGGIRLWHIIVLYFVFGAILAIDHPARRAFLVDLVPPDDLAGAVALNGAIFNFSGLIGYALGGVLIAIVGAGAAMLLNALTYLAPLVALALIRLDDHPAQANSAPGAKESMAGALSEGLLTLWRQPAILGVMSLMALSGGLAWPVFGMLPAYAEAVIHTDAIGLGVLMAAGALGSVLGTVIVTQVGKRARGRTLTLVSLLLPLLVMGFAYTATLFWACLLLIAVGAALLVLQSLAITLVQLQISNQVRGRVMSLYSILHAGADTGGNVAVGWLGAYLGLPLALGLGGAAALLYAMGVRLALPAVEQLE